MFTKVTSFNSHQENKNVNYFNKCLQLDKEHVSLHRC